MHCGIVKMASRSQQNTMSSVDQKKQELLRRIEAKKSGNFSASTNASLSTASVSNANNSPNPNVNHTLFNNDGNFLARFQAMQQQQSSSPQTPEPNKSVPSSEDNSKKKKVTVSMKVVKTSVPSTKTTNKPKAKLSRFDVFETPEEETVTIVGHFGKIHLVHLWLHRQNENEHLYGLMYASAWPNPDASLKKGTE
ncbi:Hypothetical predicted protein [Paramuricea clavata]|uniref:Uncharacterized protein n=1 Tax=Paramuricea clavata TaxID=317549 RepID=A0A6S7GBB0_PARCT|nr:Hypothetical predicted protein [Paramuricea clavata]